MVFFLLRTIAVSFLNFEIFILFGTVFIFLLGILRHKNGGNKEIQSISFQDTIFLIILICKLQSSIRF